MMLASRGAVEDIDRLQAEGYLFDLKIDGVRCLATVKDGHAALASRTGQSLTSAYPEIALPLGRMFTWGTWVFDGEIAVNDERGLPSWPLTHKRNAQGKNASYWSQQMPATYYVFDVLEAGHADLRTTAYANRRQALEAEFRPGDGRIQPNLSTADGHALWDVVCQHRMEGMVAKRAESPYRDGRSSDWVKIKRTSTVSCMVGGYDPGEGSRAGTFGGLHLYLLDDDGLVPVGKVGSGFSDVEIRRVMQAMHHPPLIVEVEYLDVSPDGQLRQPVFQRVREDLAVTDCTIDQLEVHD